MTEIEKKAEERCKKEFCTHCVHFGKCEQSIIFCTKGKNYCKSIIIELLKKENEELKKELEKWKEEHHEQVLLANEEGWNRTQLQIENNKLNEQIEKMKCCGNCGNERCTSKYRGNSCYHRQEDGYVCADNEDWIPRKDK